MKLKEKTNGVKANAKMVQLESELTPEGRLNNPILIQKEIIEQIDEDECITRIVTGSTVTASLVVTADNKYAIAGAGSNVHIIDLETKAVNYTFTKPHNGAIQRILVTKDSQTLITSSKANSIKFWSLDTKEQISEIKDVHASYVQSIFLTDDEKYLISCGSSSTPATFEIKIWDVQSKQCIGTIDNAHSLIVYCTSVTKDNKYLISASQDKSIKMWNFGTWTLAHHFVNAHFGAILFMKNSEDDRFLYSASQDGSIGVWDLQTKKHVHTFVNAHGSAVWGLASGKDDRILFSCSQDSTVSVWDLETKTHLHRFQSFKEIIYKVAATPDWRYLVATGAGGTVFIIDFGIEKEPVVLKDAHTKVIDAIEMTSDDKYLITAADDSCVKVWDYRTKELVQTFENPDGVEFWGVAVSPDNTRIATASNKGKIDMWSLVEMTHLFTYTDSHTRGCSCVLFTSDGKRVISGAHDYSIVIRDAESPTTLKRLANARSDIIVSLTITRDDKFLISGGADRSITIFELETMERVHKFKHAHSTAVRKLKLTSDDRFLISGGSGDQTLKVWDMQTKKCSYVFASEHKAILRNISISKDNKYFFTQDSNGYIEAHHLQTKQRIFAYGNLQGERTLSGKLTADGSELVFGREGSVCRIENPFVKLTVQYSEDFFPYSKIRFMPLINFFQNRSIESRQNIIRGFPKLQIYPAGWNWFHIAAVFSPQKEIIMTCLENNIPYKTDCSGKTPLHYLLEREDIDFPSIYLLLSKFSIILGNEQQSFELLQVHGDILCKILDLDCGQVVSFLKQCVRNPESDSDKLVDTFGEVKDGSERRFHSSISRLYSDSVRDDLIAINKRKKVSIQMLPFAWNYSLASMDMKALAQVLFSLNTQEIFETKVISTLIEFLWRESKIFYSMMGLIASVYAILISIYTARDDRSLGLEIPIFIIAIFYIIYELMEIISGGLIEYFKSFWNSIDVFGSLLVPATIIAVWSDIEEEPKSWLFSFVLVYAYMKWLSYFRIFGQTRKLMRMTVEIIKDIRSFATILAFIIFGLSLIFLQFDRETSYPTHLLNSYQLLFSSFDLSEASTGTTFYLLIVIALVCIVLLNMLIAMMGETFGKVQESSVIVDSKEVVDMVLESIKIRRIFALLKSKQRVHEEEERKRFLFFAEEKVEEEASEQEELQEKVESLSEQLKVANSNIENLKSSMEDQSKVLRELLQKIENLQSKDKS